MYYHTDMRYVAIIVAVIIALASPAAALRYKQPGFTLQDAVLRDMELQKQHAWRTERVFDGIGWKIGTVSRGDGAVMDGGYTVVHPTKGNPFSWKGYYVLAAFDLMPHGFLLVTVRDPERYWKEDFDRDAGIADPVEAVWYNGKWEEEMRTVIEFPADSYPDKFILAPDEKTLLAVLHPVDPEGKLEPSGQRLVQVVLITGEVVELPVPGTGGALEPPAAWWPVLMEWSPRGDLLMQAGEEFRRYTVDWL